MGCLGLGVAALLALAVPLSIARASLVGAYLVIVLLTAVAVVALAGRARRTALIDPSRGTAGRYVWVGLLAVAYGVVVTVVHAT